MCGPNLDLRFDSKGFGWFCGDGSDPVSVAQVLDQKVVEIGFDRFIFSKAVGLCDEPLQPQFEEPCYDKLVLESGVVESVGVKCYKLPFLVVGLRWWWVWGCFVIWTVSDHEYTDAGFRAYRLVVLLLWIRGGFW